MSNFSGSEFSKALSAFDHVIQDQACPSGRLDWEQNKLIKLVRARDIPLNLAMATLAKLISVGVIKEGKSFAHINDVTLLFTGEVVKSSTVHDRYLHLLMDEWNRRITEFKRQINKDKKVEKSIEPQTTVKKTNRRKLSDEVQQMFKLITQLRKKGFTWKECFKEFKKTYPKITDKTFNSTTRQYNRHKKSTNLGQVD